MLFLFEAKLQKVSHTTYFSLLSACWLLQGLKTGLSSLVEHEQTYIKHRHQRWVCHHDFSWCLLCNRSWIRLQLNCRMQRQQRLLYKEKHIYQRPGNTGRTYWVYCVTDWDVEHTPVHKSRQTLSTMLLCINVLPHQTCSLPVKSVSVLCVLWESERCFKRFLNILNGLNHYFCIKMLR